MRSSRTEALQTITSRYRSALEALLVDDFERLGALLDDVDELLLASGDPALDDQPTEAAREEAYEGYRTLLSAVLQSTDETRKALAELRSTKKAVSGYGGRGQMAGTRLLLDA